MLNIMEIQAAALDWGIDYKPWENNMDPREYAIYGYEQGYLRARQDILRDLGLTEIKTSV